MLLPKRTKYKKQQKGRLKIFVPSTNKIKDAKNNIYFGQFAIIAQSSGKINSKQIEACRIAIKRKIRPLGKMWIRIFPNVPISGKPTQIRMGKGKGLVQYWVAKVAIGMILFEISNITKTVAHYALNSGLKKLPVKSKIVQKARYK